MTTDEKIYSLMVHAEDLQTHAEKLQNEAQATMNALTQTVFSAKGQISRTVLVWFFLGVVFGAVLTVALAAALFLGFS